MESFEKYFKRLNIQAQAPSLDLVCELQRKHIPEYL